MRLHCIPHLVVLAGTAAAHAAAGPHAGRVPFQPGDTCSWTPLVSSGERAHERAGTDAGMGQQGRRGPRAAIAVNRLDQLNLGRSGRPPPKAGPGAWSAQPQPQQPKPPQRKDAPGASGGWSGPHGCAGAYCVYAFPGFAAGQGMVVITTAANAALVRRAAEGVGLAAEESASDASPPFRVAPIPGKGLGLVATRAMKRGERLMVAHPALLAHRRFLDGEVERAVQHRLLVKAVMRYLPEGTRREFLAQVGQRDHGHAHGQDSDHEDYGGETELDWKDSDLDALGARIWDIMWTNSFQMDVNPGGDEQGQGQGSSSASGDGHHYGNFPRVSRLNHDCRPNTAFRLGSDGDLLSHRTTVARAVAPGEELAISYLDALAPRAARQSRAMDAWGFECRCAACAAAPKEVARSDKRLAEMREIEAALEDFASRGVSVKRIERLLELCKLERLDAFAAGPYTLAALNFNMLGRKKKAALWAERAAEANVVEHGQDAPDAQAMMELAHNPEGHFTWRARIRAP